jgi:hypothetical protein
MLAVAHIDSSSRSPVPLKISLSVRFGDEESMNQVYARRTLAVLLVLCILFVGGFASAQSITHEQHHAHHQKATHGTVLCSWICAAGTVLDSAVVTFQAELSPIAIITLPHFSQPSIEVCQTSSSRAPPSFSL